MLKIISYTIGVLTLFGCAGKRERVVETPSTAYGTKGYAESLVSAVKPRWFNTVERFQLQREGEIQPHLFFDVFPNLSKEDKVINFVATTPQNFPTEQELDLSSGQLYLSRKYCSRSDAWKEYKGEIRLPPFTTGVVPRVLDQINLPQKIIVFGQDGYYQKYFKTNYFDARIIGAYVEQVCPQGGCVQKDSWLSRLVLIGVQKDNEKYKQIESVEELKKIVDWKSVKAFIENAGRNNIGGKLYPAYRMGAVVDASQAFYFLKENSHFFNNDDLKKMRLGCYKLYDHLWRDHSRSASRGKDKLLKSLEEGKETFYKKEEVAIEKIVDPFHVRFRDNFKKYHAEFKTCSKYVYSSSINEDPKRHWFFVYLEGFHRLHELGYYYDCARGAWTPNPLVEGGKRAVPLEKQFSFCSTEDINEAMAKMPRYLEVLKERGRSSFRYVDYDNSEWGTHNKLYSWVKHDNKVLECAGDGKGSYFKNTLSTFPKDIRWRDLRKEGI